MLVYRHTAGPVVSHIHIMVISLVFQYVAVLNLKYKGDKRKSTLNLFFFQLCLSYYLLFITDRASVSLHVSGVHVTENHGFTIKENSAMKITCKSDANPPTNTTLQEKTNSGWNLLRADSSFSFQNETTVINVYIFQNVTRSFSGHYRCVANNSISSFSVAALEVLCKYVLIVKAVFCQFLDHVLNFLQFYCSTPRVILKRFVKCLTAKFVFQTHLKFH